MEEKTTLKGSPVGGWLWVSVCACVCECVKKSSLLSISYFGPDFFGADSHIFLGLA